MVLVPFTAVLDKPKYQAICPAEHNAKKRWSRCSPAKNAGSKCIWTTFATVTKRRPNAIAMRENVTT
ncbi:hypothetical protein niasHT_028476 [Heterodera trifolii]|uniref:Uncharacterized protein n=1 Tax=Heterodera trifolii TaxID=157864 RepID=A0ABD2KQ85_9BILA